jgi:hypothetical protein
MAQPGNDEPLLRAVRHVMAQPGNDEPLQEAPRRMRTFAGYAGGRVLTMLTTVERGLTRGRSKA